MGDVDFRKISLREEKQDTGPREYSAGQAYAGKKSPRDLVIYNSKIVRVGV